MIGAPGLSEFSREVLSNLANEGRMEEIVCFDLMVAMDGTDLQVEVDKEKRSKLVGILLARPATKFVRTEITGHLDYFHIRSASSIDFLCAGYGAYWPQSRFSDQRAIAKIDGIEWMFSERAFSNVVDELEAKTNWTFSGETELLLLSAEGDSSGRGKLNFDTAIVCNLEQMTKENAISSVRAYFTDLINFAKKKGRADPTWALGDRFGAKVVAEEIRNGVLSVLPLPARNLYRKAQHFAVRNLSK